MNIVGNWEALKAFNQLIFCFALDRRNNFSWITLIGKQEAMEMWFVWGTDVASGQKNNTEFIIFNKISQKLIMQMHEVDAVHVYQFILGNQMHTTS